jgi:Peptidase family M28
VASVLSELAGRYLRCVRMDEVMAHLTRLTEHDRYQASLGIERAADLIASAAEALGLADVTVERFTADGTTRWWSFQAPRAWTPTTARLEIRAAGRSVIAVDHAAQPFTIATYSAPTPPAGLIARVVDVHGDLAGAVAVIGAADFARPELLAALAERGAVGFVTDAPCRGPSGEHPGRIELDARTSLFGFSVTAGQRQAIETAGAGAEAHVRVDIDRSASMPVVTGVLPGRGAGEVWLTSHLCHPRPGANDNASGAAALLGVAAALADRRLEIARDLDRSIRFVWGPEFVGVAALIHQRYGRLGRDGRPMAVINLDMVGEDPSQCGVPLVVERAPDWCPSVITPLAEHVVEQVFAHTSAHAGTWRPGPFLGYSDHALFANFSDPDWRSPAVQLWHPGDPFNHSAADSLDKVSAMEMRRATAAGAVLAETLASDAAWSRAALEQVVQRWCDREEQTSGAVAHRYREVKGGAWSRRFVDHVHRQGTALRALVDDGPAAWRCPRRPDRRAFVGRWPGPFNYRGLLAELSAARRADVVALFLSDKRNYAVLTHLAMLADGCGSRDEVIDAASLALRFPVDEAVAGRLWSALLESAWIEEA